MKQKSYFWASYADLMTTLFFIMLVLFVSTFIIMNDKGKANKEQIEKIRSLEGSVRNIDQGLFKYNEEYQKHVLQIEVKYEAYKFSPRLLDAGTRQKLINAGRKIKNFVDKAYDEYKSPFLIIVEGQASKDNYNRDEYNNNDILSYNRALYLVKLWEDNGIRLRSPEYNKKAELLICGSGTSGAMRSQPDDPFNKENQRFLIHILPKPGIIKAEKDEK